MSWLDDILAFGRELFGGNNPNAPTPPVVINPPASGNAAASPGVTALAVGAVVVAAVAVVVALRRT